MIGWAYERASGWVAVLLGVITGVAGGSLRDVLLGEVPLVYQSAIHLYATAALYGTVVFTANCHVGAALPVATPTGIAPVLGLRLASTRGGYRRRNVKRWRLKDRDLDEPAFED